MIFWHAGAAAALRNLSLVNTNTPVAGASGGAIVATLLAAGVDPSEIMAALPKPDCADHPSAQCGSVLGGGDGGDDSNQPAAAPSGPAPCAPKFKGFIPFLKLTLNRLLPGDAPARISAQGSLHIWASQLDPTAPAINPGTGPLAFDLGAYWPAGSPSGYPSKEDLIESAAASAWVPCAVGAFTFTRHRGHAWMDGGAAASMDDMCGSMAGAGGSGCVKVVATAVGPQASSGNVGACPFATSPSHLGTFPGHPGLSLLPPPALPELCQRYCDANGHAASEDFHPVQASVDDPAMTLCPGCHAPFPFTFCDAHTFSKFAFGSGPGKTIAALYQLGWAEAMAWAAGQGLGPPPAAAAAAPVAA